MANTFQEFLQQKGVSTQQYKLPEMPQIKEEPKLPFTERKGLVQTIFKPAIELGKDIAYFLEKEKTEKRQEDYRQYMTGKLKITNLPERTKQILANSLDEENPFKNVFEPKSTSQIIGDVLGTALFVLPVGQIGAGVRAISAVKGLAMGGKLVKGFEIAGRGAAVGGAFGVAEALAEKEDTAGFLKDVATGAAFGLGVEFAGVGAVKGVQIAAKGIKNIFSKILSNPVAETTRKFFSSLGGRLQKDFGEEGKDIAERFLTSDRDTLLKVGGKLDKLNEAGFFKLSDKESLMLTDILEGRVKPIPKELEPLAQEARKYKSVEEFVKKGILEKQYPLEGFGNTATKGIALHGTNVPQKVLSEGFKTGEGTFGRGVYLDPLGDRAVASYGGQSGKNILAVEYNFKKPYIVKEVGEKVPSLDLLKKQGYDGVVFQNRTGMGRGIDEIIAFDKLSLKPSQLTDFYTQAVKGIKEVKPEIIPQNLRKSFKVIDEIREEIGQEAQRLGVRIRLKAGIDYPFKPRGNYYPHIVPTEDTLLKGKLREEVLDNALRINKFKTKEEAMEVLDSYLEFVRKEGKGGKFWINYLLETGQAKTADEARGKTLRFFKASRINRSGHLEKAREMDFPFYIQDARKTIPMYLMGTVRRLEEIKQFGLKFEKIESLMGRIARTQGREAGKEIRTIIKKLTGAIETSPQKQKVIGFLKTLQIPKLAFAQILNIGQNINTLLSTDAPTFLKALAWSFTEEGKKNALKSGSILETILRETRKIAGGEEGFGSGFLRYVGFTATEKANRTVATNAGIIYASKTLQKLKRNPLNRVYRTRLEELKINPDEALKKGYLTDNELLMAGQIMSEKTQFRNRPIDLPAFVASPEGKLIFQFKTFAYHQTKLLKDRFLQQIRNNNYSGLARDLMILSTVFPLTGEIIADIRSLITGQERKTEAFDRYLENLITVGGMGILSDTIQSASWGRLSEYILGPAVSSTIVEPIERITKATQRGEMNKGDIKYLLRQTGFGRTFANYLFPNNRKEQETFLDTLIESFEEF